MVAVLPLQLAALKRRAPDVDWRTIMDPAERRKQRRLAKNRITAARSRERKKTVWADMESHLSDLESENSQLRAALESLAAENSTLKGMLASPTRGASGIYTAACTGDTEPDVLLKCLAILHLVCLLPTVSCLFGVLLSAAQLSCGGHSRGGLLGQGRKEELLPQLKSTAMRSKLNEMSDMYYMHQLQASG